MYRDGNCGVAIYLSRLNLIFHLFFYSDHIWQYDGYAGYDAHRALNSKRSQELDQALRPLLSSRSNWITQEFAFWPTCKPRVTDGLYELRTYHLKPGHLLEWEQHW